MTASKIPLRGILRDMAEVKDMYKVARFVDSDNYDPPRKSFKEPRSAIADCAIRYADKKWRLSERKALNLLDNTMAHKYVEVIGDVPTGHILRVTSGRGRQLVAKKWFIYPSGLIEQSAKEYPRTHSIIKSTAILIFSVISAAIGSMATYILSH